MKIKKNIALLRAIAALSLFGAAGADAAPDPAIYTQVQQ
jgi:hypothetical protein